MTRLILRPRTLSDTRSREFGRAFFSRSKVSARHFRCSEVNYVRKRKPQAAQNGPCRPVLASLSTTTIPIEETMGAMQELVDTGKIQFIGVSNFMLHELKNAAEGDDQVPDCFKPVRYNLIDRTIDYGLLKYCQEHHITVIAHSPSCYQPPQHTSKGPRESARQAGTVPLPDGGAKCSRLMLVEGRCIDNF